MAKQTINIGTVANDGTGDPLRTAFGKVNSNFTELYDAGYITANSLPTSLSELTNDTGFITANEAEFITANSLPTALSELTNDVGYITANSLPTNISELSNDSGYITANTGHIILNDRYTLGTPVSFSNQSNTSLVDVIGPGVSIARDPGGGGIYNPEQEADYDQTNRDSPLGTEWNYEGNGFGNLDTIKNRYYTTFAEALKHAIGRNIIGAGLIMHDTINDKYYKFEFSHWGQQAVGTFAYTRTEIIIDNIGVEFADGTYQPTAWTGYLNKYNKVHVGPYSGHELSAAEAGSVIYFFNTHVILPNNEENDCEIGSFYTLIVGDTAASLRVKKYVDTSKIPTIESAIEPDLNVGPFNDTDYPLEPYSVAHLIKIEKNKWSLVPAGIASSFAGSVEATTLSSNTVISNLVPSIDDTYDLGSPTNQWRSLYVGANTIFVGGTPISVDAGGNLLVSGSPVSGGSTGNITFDGVKIQGAGAASGDGNGYSTIELVPDTDLYNNDQYLIVDPTQPNHIHMRAGGTQDNSAAELFLGGEKNHVRVIDGTGVRLYNEDRNDAVSYFQDPTDFNTATWYGTPGSYFVEFTQVTAGMGDLAFNFGNDDENRVTVYYGSGESSVLTYGGSASNLGGGVYRFAVVEAPPVSPTSLTAIEFQIWSTNNNRVELQNNDLTISVEDDIRITGNDIFSLRNRSRDEDIEIHTDYDNNDYVWTFGFNGTFNTPGDIVVNGDVTGTTGGSTLVLRAEPSSSTIIQLNDTVDSTIGTSANLEIRTDVSNIPYVWTFGTDGSLTFPDSTVQTTAYTGDYLDLSNTPSSLSEFTNDTGFITANSLPTNVSDFNNDAGFITANSLPTDVSELNNDAGYLTAVPSSISVDTLSVNDGVQEKFQSLADATGTVTHDCSGGQIFYHTSPDANWTVNLTNLNLASTYATSVTLIIIQGDPAYYPNALQIAGSAQTINWQGGSAPTPTASGIDVVTFSIINNSGTYTVLGQLTDFNTVP